MPIIDSKNGKIKKDYSIEELIEKAQEMRAYNMISITAAGSGVSPTHNSHLASAKKLYISYRVKVLVG